MGLPRLNNRHLISFEASQDRDCKSFYAADAAECFAIVGISTAMGKNTYLCVPSVSSVGRQRFIRLWRADERVVRYILPG